MEEQEIINRIALKLVKGVGAVRYKNLITAFGSATAVFANKDARIDSIDKIGTVHFKAVREFADYSTAEMEYEFVKKNNIQVLTFDNDNYPVKLKRAIDSPPLLFYRGTDSIHNTRVISIIGTRACSDYGKKLCEQIVDQLAPANPLIVSGLAYGIDSVAHRAAVRNGLSTIGVMATGLDKIYPSQNKKLANEMLDNGGLLSEFSSNTKPDRENFPLRNRIVAGMADAVIVIETAKKGGSMITANLADSYNRDVFCVPGRADDKRSEGCNFLIKSLRASLITSGADVLYNLRWDETEDAPNQQRKLFVELTKNEKLIYDTLQLENGLHIDELFSKTQLSMSQLATLLLQLEMTGMVRSMPGKLYQAI